LQVQGWAGLTVCEACGKCISTGGLLPLLGKGGKLWLFITDVEEWMIFDRSYKCVLSFLHNFDS